ncbi:hypothetical protein OHA98_32725 [Streptomyces sp. NBC_00654]|uniref:RNase A-like domain-containing protein n=1 Tax=Streptomyces sp. NBC_00654 TaxID=2975799 RepID=UPI002255FEBA|nr:RNase A-like domain-containing protein [Streptomyces sp. NBC_00654]MCX4969439.1 hypothetical protein [Streptomyces sp. NBC_00654]
MPATPQAPGLPEPSPGKLVDPQGKDISQHDTGSAKRALVKEVEDLRPAAGPGPGPGGGFDVQPPHLYYTSYLIRNLQFAFKEHPDRLLDSLRGHGHACGTGRGPSAFTTAYDKVCRLYLQVWAKSVVSIGGASVGLTMTSNNYVAAEYASNPQAGPPPAPKALPGVISRAPSYGDVTGLGWHDGGGGGPLGDQIVDGAAEIVSFIGKMLLRPILKYALRHGRVAEITPGGDDSELPKVAQAWRQIADDARKSGGDLDGAIGYITNNAPGQDEWQGAMHQFCSSLWGTTPYGNANLHNRSWKHDGRQQPVLSVLSDSAREIARALDEFKTKVSRVRQEITDVYKQAAKDLVDHESFKSAGETIFKVVGANIVGLAEQFIENIDTNRLNAAVDAYNRETEALADILLALEPALNEALLSAPTYEAEEARAQAIGARALDEFKQPAKYTVPGGSATAHAYPIDLANQENMAGSHPVDKHVGKTDEQLQQRLRDDLKANGEIRPSAASTYATLADAQQITQAVIDKESPRIAAWLAGNPPGNTLPLPHYDAPDDAVTGRTVPKTGPHTYGAPTYATGAKVILRRLPGSNPPSFVVLTSYPD